jgi:hypothetical protein
MVKKKSVKNRESRKIFKSVNVSDNKFNFVSKRLLFFAMCFIISFALYFATSKPVLEEVFTFLSIIFGFISIAYLIVFLIFVFMRIKK